MKMKEITGLSQEELGQKERNLKKELFDMNYERKMGRVEKPGRFRLIKRDIARILTVLNEREKDESKTK